MADIADFATATTLDDAAVVVLQPAGDVPPEKMTGAAMRTAFAGADGTDGTDDGADGTDGNDGSTGATGPDGTFGCGLNSSRPDGGRMVMMAMTVGRRSNGPRRGHLAQIPRYPDPQARQVLTGRHWNYSYQPTPQAPTATI